MKSLDNELLSTYEICSQVKDCYDLSLTFKTIMTFISGNKCRKTAQIFIVPVKKGRGTVHKTHFWIYSFHIRRMFGQNINRNGLPYVNKSC
jgi:hypothetical protein